MSIGENVFEFFRQKYLLKIFSKSTITKKKAKMFYVKHKRHDYRRFVLGFGFDD